MLVIVLGCKYSVFHANYQHFHKKSLGNKEYLRTFASSYTVESKI